MDFKEALNYFEKGLSQLQCGNDKDGTREERGQKEDAYRLAICAIRVAMRSDRHKNLTSCKGEVTQRCAEEEDKNKSKSRKIVYRKHRCYPDNTTYIDIIEDDDDDDELYIFSGGFIFL